MTAPPPSSDLTPLNNAHLDGKESPRPPSSSLNPLDDEGAPPPSDLSRLVGVPLDDEGAPPPTDLSRLAGVPLDDEGAPVFAEPWEASAFALAVRLSAAGCFTWSEWAAALAGEIRAAGEAGDPDLGGGYYRHWTRALERLCAERGLVSPEEAERRKEAWRAAYLAAPHGHPVALPPEDAHA